MVYIQIGQLRLDALKTHVVTIQIMLQTADSKVTKECRQSQALRDLRSATCQMPSRRRNADTLQGTKLQHSAQDAY